MKTLLLFTAIIMCISTNAQVIASTDVGAAYRFKPMLIKGKVLTEQKQTTAMLNVNIAYKIHLESNSKHLDIVLESNTRLPVIDNINPVSSGMRAGFIVPLGKIELLPMGCLWLNFGNAVPNSIKYGYSVRAIVNANDFQWYVDAAHTGAFAGIGIGLVLPYNGKRL